MKNKLVLLKNQLGEYSKILRNQEQSGIKLGSTSESKVSLSRDLEGLRIAFFDADTIEQKKEILAIIESVTGTTAVDLRLNLYQDDAPSKGSR